MNNDAKVQYELLKKMHVFLVVKGIQQDPMYIERCLETFFGEGYAGKEGEIIPTFIEELRHAIDSLRRSGLIEFFGRDLDIGLLLDRAIHSPDRLKCGDYLIKYTTGRSRDEWLTEYHLAQDKDHDEWLTTRQPRHRT